MQLVREEDGSVETGTVPVEISANPKTVPTDANIPGKRSKDLLIEVDQP